MKNNQGEKDQASANSSDATAHPDSFLDPEPFEADQEMTETTDVNHDPGGNDSPISLTSPGPPRMMLYPGIHVGDQQVYTSPCPPLNIGNAPGGSGSFSYLSTRPRTPLPGEPLRPASNSQTTSLRDTPLHAASSIPQTLLVSDAPLRSTSTALPQTRNVRDVSRSYGRPNSGLSKRASGKKLVKRYTCDKCGEVVSKKIGNHIKHCLGPPNLETKLSNPWWCIVCGKRFKKYLERMTDVYCHCDEDGGDKKKDSDPDVSDQGRPGSSLQNPYYIS